IVFFVNWMAYNQAKRGWFWNTLTPLINFRYYIRAAGRMAGVAQRGAGMNDGKGFRATQASTFLYGFDFRKFLEDCYSENRRRMGTFGKDLLRPDFLPQLADVALSALRLWQQKPRSQAPA